MYEFLSDGAAPERAAVDEWMVAATSAEPPFGLWLLEDDDGELLGCVRLATVDDMPGAAELTYVVHPDYWGQGLATAMSRTVIAMAFSVTACEQILAGADLPNSRSIVVMQRLGMQYLRDVEYPAGPGVEYRLMRSDFQIWSADETLPIA